jgi:hypothetical protein
MGVGVRPAHPKDDFAGVHVGPSTSNPDRGAPGLHRGRDINLSDASASLPGGSRSRFLCLPAPALAHISEPQFPQHTCPTAFDHRGIVRHPGTARCSAHVHVEPRLCFDSAGLLRLSTRVAKWVFVPWVYMLAPVYCCAHKTGDYHA